MSAETPSGENLPSRTVNVKLDGGDWEMNFRVQVSDGPVRIADMLPIARSISDAVVGASSQMVESAGEKISCTKGCGACCRYLVAISQAEARSLHQLVEALPEPRRTVVRERFSAAKERLQAAGLIERLQHTEELDDAQYEALCGAYAAQAVVCPFLEDGSCSIYAERPVTCREYLVMSHPEHCAESHARNVRRVRLPMHTSSAFMRLHGASSGSLLEPWVPLILAPEWAETHPDEIPPQPAIELFRELLELIADTRGRTAGLASS
jgi:Fe-S-cluster containining protein